jgi:UDP-glucuronate decarboxylase
MENKTIVITGGAGFIGNNLASFLLEKGHKVICIDNLFFSNYQNINHLLKNKNFKFIRADVVSKKAFSKIKGRIDEVYALASIASPKIYKVNKLETIKVNTIGVINTLKFAKKKKAKVLLASSSEVYGTSKKEMSEDNFGNVNPIGPRSCYTETKRTSETIAQYFKEKGLDVRIIRIFNTYGPGMNLKDGRVFSDFIFNLIHETPFVINGDGKQIRSFCYIDDLINAINIIMNSEENNGVINVGNVESISIKNLKELLEKKVGVKKLTIYKNIDSDDTLKRIPVIDKILNMGWKPSINLMEGVDKTLKFYGLIE